MIHADSEERGKENVLGYASLYIERQVLVYMYLCSDWLYLVNNNFMVNY